MFEDFLDDLDDKWTEMSGSHLELKVLGSTALFLQTGYERGTKDSDIIKTHQMSKELCDLLDELAGKGSPLHQKHRVYLDIVGPNVPMLPREPIWQPYTGVRLRNFRVSVLDIADVLVSKLKRFHGDDQDDIQAMIDNKALTHEHMLERFFLVIDRYRHDGQSRHLPKMAQRFNDIERDGFLVDETDFRDELDALQF